MQRKFLLTALFSIGFLQLSGCSMLNTGEDSFACKGSDCKTPLEIYKDTNATPDSVSVGRTPPEWKVDPDGEKMNADDKEKENQNKAFLRKSLELTKMYPAKSFDVNKEVVKPIREPSRVMRVWIAPWVDSTDNLNWSSYTFTEVTTKRWNYGEQEVRQTGLMIQSIPEMMKD